MTVSQGVGSADAWEEESGDPIPARSAVAMWRQLSPFLDGMRGALPAIALLAMIGSILDGVGVGLIVLFLNVLFGGAAGADTLAETFGGRVGGMMSAVAGRPTLLGCIIGGLFLAKIATSIIHALLISVVEQRLNHRLRQQAFTNLLNRPHELVMHYGKARIITIFDRHLFAVSEALDNFFNLAVSLIAALVLGVLLIWTSWPIAIAAVIAGVAHSAFIARFRIASAASSDRSVDVLRGMNAVLVATLDALRTIRIFGQERRYVDRFSRASATMRDVDIALERHTSLTGPVTELSGLIALGICGITAVLLHLPPLETLTALAILSRLQPYVTGIEEARVGLARVAAPFEAMVDLAAQEPGDAGGGKPRIGGLGEGIRFAEVDFAFGATRPVLRETSFLIPAGRWTWLDGPSGAGKSTVVNLLSGLYPPTGGAVLVDGMPIVGIDRDSFTGLLSFAGQDVELFEGTLADNLRWGRLGADQGELEVAARDADIHDFIIALPQGYDTPLSDRALDLSGGQRQRLGIARALLRNPQLLILDEATNAVSADSEARIMAAIRRRMAGKTVFAISHHATGRATDDCVLRLVDGAVTSAEG